MAKWLVINHTNHPSQGWSESQTVATRTLFEVWTDPDESGDPYLTNPRLEDIEIIDFPFPDIDPEDDEFAVSSTAFKTVDEIRKIARNSAGTVIVVQGEPTYTARLVQLLQCRDIRVYAATTKRVSKEIHQADGSVRKISEFKFVRFRKYPDLLNF